VDPTLKIKNKLAVAEKTLGFKFAYLQQEVEHSITFRTEEVSNMRFVLIAIILLRVDEKNALYVNNVFNTNVT
jgi:hypothetical protein